MIADPGKQGELRFKQNARRPVMRLRMVIALEVALAVGVTVLWFADGLTFLPAWGQILIVIAINVAVAIDVLTWPARERQLRDSHVILGNGWFSLEYAGKRTSVRLSSLKLERVVMNSSRIDKLILRLPYGRLSLQDYEDMDGLRDALMSALKGDPV